MRHHLKRIHARAKPYAGYAIIGLALLLLLSVIRASIFSEVPEDKKIWFEIAFILLVAISAELLVSYLKQPMVMILLILGVAISPSAVSLASPYISKAVVYAFSFAGMTVPITETIPRLVPTEGFISVFAKLGAIFLLFKIGMHSEISKIFNGKNFLVALIGVILPFAAGYYYAAWMGHGFLYSMFLAAALTATSVGVTAAVLEEFKVLDKEYAKIILGAAVIDDILGLLVLSIVVNAPSKLDASVLSPLASVFATAIIFVIGGIKIGQYLVAKYFDKCCQADGRISNASFLAILVYVLSYAYVAEYIGLSAIVGAFLAGVTLNYSKNINKIIETFYPLEAFFTPIFFISLGMFVDIKALSENLIPIIEITAIAVATKMLGCSLMAAATKTRLKDSIIVGIGMIPRGEVALIIGLYGLTMTTAAGGTVLSTTEYSMIASMAFLTTVIVPPILRKSMEYAGY